MSCQTEKRRDFLSNSNRSNVRGDYRWMRESFVLKKWTHRGYSVLFFFSFFFRNYFFSLLLTEKKEQLLFPASSFSCVLLTGHSLQMRRSSQLNIYWVFERFVVEPINPSAFLCNFIFRMWFISICISLLPPPVYVIPHSETLIFCWLCSPYHRKVIHLLDLHQKSQWIFCLFFYHSLNVSNFQSGSRWQLQDWSESEGRKNIRQNFIVLLRKWWILRKFVKWRKQSCLLYLFGFSSIKYWRNSENSGEESKKRSV